MHKKSPDNDIAPLPSAEEQSQIKGQHVEDAEHETDSPAAERGERMESSKTIARGGKSGGKVPGTSSTST